MADVKPLVARGGRVVVADGGSVDGLLSAEIDAAPDLHLPRPSNPEARLELGSANTLSDGRIARSILFRVTVRDTLGRAVRTQSGKSYRRKSTYVARIYNINSVRELKAHLG